MDSRLGKQNTLEAFYQAVIRSRLGDISTLPEKLVDHISRIYREFIAAYLNLLRQEENKPDGWYPQEWSINPELVDEMRHFFPTISISPGSFTH